MKRLFAVLALTITTSFVAAGSVPQSNGDFPNDPKATPAYAVLVRRKAAVEADLADLSSKLTDGSRDVRAKRFELSALGREIERMRRIGRGGVPKLSSAYGDLILSKIALEVELNELLSNYTPEHPDVKKKQVELAALEREIGSLLK
jgi:uncharacterized protein involved in exopolysaccharide biosynthesis